MIRCLKLELSYDGSNYSGWQEQKAQPNVKTVQGEIQRVLERITGQKIPILGSGRTDAGVHALYQTASFLIEENTLAPEVFTRALNAFLPSDIRIWRTTEADPNFHPIRDVVRKRYRYLMSDQRPFLPMMRNYVWWSSKPLDRGPMGAAAQFLQGTHDFRAFQTEGSPRRSTVRTIFEIQLKEIPTPIFFDFPAQKRDPGELPVPSLLALEVEADGFLYNMVRAIAGTLYLFGRKHKGFEDPEAMKKIVDSGDRALAGPTAPPHGLYMIDVVY
ncbi:MAG: tRNA pseudouridine(38-40) synthase TruA [Planctomycetia bacterium]|nr:tRNA pseudouridine(38-40) synthase TruA [Planctomycetia bacterium]